MDTRFDRMPALADPGRRRLLVAAAAGAITPVALATPTVGEGSVCELAFRHTHTGERLRLVYRQGGSYHSESLARIDWLLRDFRTGDSGRIEPGLLDLLHMLANRFDGRPFDVISAFRSPRTNEMLRETGGGGVARRSLHLEGRAIDIRIVGVDTARLRDAALELRAGGVGFYPGSDFVHLDTGAVRSWGPKLA